MNHKNKMKNMTPAELSASAQERFVADHRRHHRMVTSCVFLSCLYSWLSGSCALI